MAVGEKFADMWKMTAQFMRNERYPISSCCLGQTPYSVCIEHDVLTVPAQYTCPNGWSLEYNGYLMAEWEHNARKCKNTLCVDKYAEAVPGSQTDTNPAVVYLMKATRNGLSCPPYNTGIALPCAVCSKKPAQHAT